MELDGVTPGQLDDETERRWLAELEAALAARGEGPGLVGGPTGRRYYYAMLDAESGAERYRTWCEWARAVGIGRPPRSFAQPWPSDAAAGVMARRAEYEHERR